MGNVNVTLHVFDGHDFNTNVVYTEGLYLEFESESEAIQNRWKYYLKYTTRWINEIPGMGFNANSEYSVGHTWDDANSTLDFFVGLVNGAVEQYEEVHIIQIEVNNKEDHTSAKEATKVIPKGLDTSDYQEVMDYYGDQVDVIQHYFFNNYFLNPVGKCT